MESQLKHNTNLAGEGEEEQGGEKLSVLQKVKAKARKIRNTIKKHGQHHGQEHDRQESHPELDDESEEEEEEDPEVHAAPIHESQTAKNPVVGFGGGQATEHQPIFERTDEAALVTDYAKVGIPTSHAERSEEAPISRGEEPKLPVSSLKEDLGAPKHTLSEQGRPGNYQTKVNDPTGQGAEETPGISPLLSSLEKIGLADKATKGAESHDHGPQQPIMERTDEAALDTDYAKVGIPTSHAERSEEAPISRGEEPKLPVSSLKEDLGAPKHTLSEQGRPGNYQTKVNDPTGQDAEETPGINPLLSSLEEMGLADKATKGAESHDDHGPQQPSNRDIQDDSPLITGEAVSQDIPIQGGYSEKLAYATAAVADKVVAAKDAAAAKLGYGNEKNDTTGSDQEDPVASKLGYGGTGEHKTPREPVDHEALMQQGQSYTEKIAGVTSALAGKAVGAKNVVALKLGYGQEGAGVAEGKNPDHASGVNVGSAGEGGIGAESPTWTEKLKPGEEDKALSELITGTVLKKESTMQEDERKSPIGETVSDTGHKYPSEHGQIETKSAQKVTEEVPQRLGTGVDEKREEVGNVPGSESPGKGVTDKIRMAVSSWWSPGDPQPDTSQTGSGEKTLQESDK